MFVPPCPIAWTSFQANQRLTTSSMTIRPPSARSYQRGMILFELIVFMVCVAIAANSSVYMASSHHWLVGFLAFPLILRLRSLGRSVV